MSISKENNNLILEYLHIFIIKKNLFMLNRFYNIDDILFFL